MNKHEQTDRLVRYQRQTIFPGLGQVGQERLLAAQVVVVGCGATGTAICNHLVRAGVGHVRIVDRDFIELNNLQRQMLFDEDDIADNLPKAEAAAKKLRVINSDIEVEAIVADVSPGNVLGLIEGATVVMDGTDNFTTRYLLNDACLSLKKPWVYTGVVASYGTTATFIPEGALDIVGAEISSTGCLRCLYGDMPAPGTMATCDTAGVIGPAVGVITSIAAGEAIKLITGKGTLNPGIIHMDVWTHDYEQFGRSGENGGKRPGCVACGQGDYQYLNAEIGTTSSILCGRNAVQVSTHNTQPLVLAQVAANLQPVADWQMHNDYLLRAHVNGYEFTIFPDNRAIIKGTEDEAKARSLYAQYIGS
ncbi:MAG: ThiF family adenylyltransferase [Chloroflexota bacterium]